MIYPRTLVFDLDGTLVDTADDLAAAMNHGLATVGRPGLPVAAVRPMVGQGARKLLEKGLAASGGGSDAEMEAAFCAFFEHYAANIARHSRAFEGVEPTLDRLSAAGCVLGICTNKPIGLTRLLLAALGWSGRFAAVLGADSLGVRKPDPEHLWATIRACGGEAGDAAFVGDSMTDALTGQAAGVPTVLVTFGFSVEPVASLPHDALIDDFVLLPGVLAAFKARSSVAA
ncbi:phosphoglycolate phosphatase [Sandaracinobacteroides saxicola]|uniref:Phosphoglycolate phosphatase n=1 Tax=Sandaracinobacteroides saxicola TaxID=2759707 RepID=A0A7G5IMK6_9SPHN|nr:phosphoglycolate phosphatase [Sandaracinobacteroides saxicola]